MKTKTFLLVGFISVAANSYAQEKKGKLVFDPTMYLTKTLTLNDKTFKVRAYEKIVYVEKPIDTAFQNMNIYIPEEYCEGKSINGYNASNAPIFFPNQIGGYMPGAPASTEASGMRMMPPLNGQAPINGRDSIKGAPGEKLPEVSRPDGIMGRSRSNTVVEALSRGYVVASAGARERTQSYGKAPAAIVDLKAAVRYFKFNDKAMPGNANKIVSNGTSAGGAMSALLGATGNNPDYEPYLKALGAAAANDNIFAVSAYCPITNLDNSDMAYEWQFYGINFYKRGGPMGAPGQGVRNLTDEQVGVSKDLKSAFPAYINSTRLKDKKGNLLTLDPNGNGSFKELVKSCVISAAQKALNNGQDLTVHQWLTISKGKVEDMDWDKYIIYMERQKAPPAFDALDLSTPETQLFGSEKMDKQHFTQHSKDHSTVTAASMADQNIIKRTNPMYYVGEGKTQLSKYWRIRHGTKDKDTGLGISVMLGTLLQNNGYDIDLELPWDKPHSGDYDLYELFQWIDSICK